MLNYATGCTCPLSCFVIFISLDPIDIEAPYFNHYNNIKTRQHLAEATLANPEHIPTPAASQAGDGYETLEFTNTPGAIVPVLWGVFLTEVPRIEI